MNRRKVKSLDKSYVFVPGVFKGHAPIPMGEVVSVDVRKVRGVRAPEGYGVVSFTGTPRRRKRK